MPNLQDQVVGDLDLTETHVFKDLGIRAYNNFTVIFIYSKEKISWIFDEVQLFGLVHLHKCNSVCAQELLLNHVFQGIFQR